MNESDIHPEPDLTLGIEIAALREGEPLVGRVGDQAVMLVRAEGGIFAVGAYCTHYHGPLAEGLVESGRIHCPRHHACFSLRTGEALQAPALDALPCWHVEVREGIAYVRERMSRPPRVSAPGKGAARKSIVIVGGGAAGVAAADMLRREGYPGELTLISAEANLPSDRPNLSKDYLDGSAPAEWVPVKPQGFYDRNGIRLLRGTPVTAIDTKRRLVRLAAGDEIPFEALLLATGSQPVHLEIPGAESQVFYLRSFQDSERILARSAGARSVVVVGTSFIGLEVAASLRRRGLEVHVVGRDRVPLERVLGSQMGKFIQSLHEAQGVTFHFEATVERVEGTRVRLSTGAAVDADFLVLGVGVRPSTTLAEQAGLAMDRGVAVDEYLQTSEPSVYAAGDIARWPDPHTGERIRVEHWVVAQRQGQVAARNLLGMRIAFDAVPFFWSQHYDVTINYVGHAQRWDAIEIDGSLEERDCTVRYRVANRTLAVATIGRDRQSLLAEVRLQRSLAGQLLR